MTQPWPWPGDDRVERVKRVALSYRRLVEAIIDGQAPDPAAALQQTDQSWQQLGVFWVLPSAVWPEDDDWLSAADAAHYADRTPRDIYNWARRSETTGVEQRTGPDGAPEYRWGSIANYYRQTRHLRERKRA